MIRARALLAGALAGGALSGSPAAHAQVQTASTQEVGARLPRVVLHGDASPELGNQLKVELMAMGFEVSQESAMEGAQVIELRMLGEDEVELHLVHGSRLKMKRPAELPARLFAMRVAEQVRASLLVSEVDEREPEVEAEAHVVPDEKTPKPEPEITPVVPSVSDKSQVNLMLGAGVEWGPGGLGAAFRVGARLEVWPFEHWGLGSIALLPVQTQNLDLGSTRVETSILSLGAGPVARFWLAPQLSLHTSLGAGGAVVTMRGDAAAPEQGTRDAVLPALIYASLAAEYFITPHWYLEASALGLYYIPTISVNLPDGVAAKRAYALSGLLGLGAAF